MAVSVREGAGGVSAEALISSGLRRAADTEPLVLLRTNCAAADDCARESTKPAINQIMINNTPYLLSAMCVFLFSSVQ